MKGRADFLAGLIAASVLVVGALVVVQPALQHRSDLANDNPFRPALSREVVEKRVPGKPVERTTTTKPASAPWVERALGNSGLLLLRVGIVVLAAFLAGAVAQRVLLGDYALKVGPVEVPALTAASDDLDASRLNC